MAAERRETLRQACPPGLAQTHLLRPGASFRTTGIVIPLFQYSTRMEHSMGHCCCTSLSDGKKPYPTMQTRTRYTHTQTHTHIHTHKYTPILRLAQTIWDAIEDIDQISVRCPGHEGRQCKGSLEHRPIPFSCSSSILTQGGPAC